MKYNFDFKIDLDDSLDELSVQPKAANAGEIWIYNYNEKYLEEKISHEIALPISKDPTITWIQLTNVYGSHLVHEMDNLFQLHPLLLVNIMDKTNLPKLEDFGTYLFIVFKILTFNKEENIIQSSQVGLILLEDFIISIQESEDKVFHVVKDRLKKNIGRIRKVGADYLAYALIDAVVDNYLVTLDKFRSKLDVVEATLLKDPEQSTLDKINQLKREITEFKNYVRPLIDVIWKMQKDQSGLIEESTFIYLKDLHDHATQALDTTNAILEIIKTMHATYMSGMTYKLNEIMKVLAVISTLFIPLTFLSSVYGMNFEVMIELKWAWAYPMVLLEMLALCFLLMYFFKRKKWI